MAAAGTSTRAGSTVAAAWGAIPRAGAAGCDRAAFGDSGHVAGAVGEPGRGREWPRCWRGNCCRARRWEWRSGCRRWRIRCGRGRWCGITTSCAAGMEFVGLSVEQQATIRDWAGEAKAERTAGSAREDSGQAGSGKGSESGGSGGSAATAAARATGADGSSF